MTLIQCPECDASVSTKAAACPNCGYPISKNLIKSLTDRAKSINTALKESKSKQVIALIDLVASKLRQGKKHCSLHTRNTFGFSMFGFYPLINNGWRVLGLSIHAFCVFYVPLIPTGIYLVERPDFDTFRFYGEVPFYECFSALGTLGTLRLIASILVDTLILQAIFVTSIVIVAFIIANIKSCS